MTTTAPPLTFDVHPTLPLLFSCCDDHFMKVWDWTKNWALMHQAAGHEHYVMALSVLPLSGTVAMVSLDHGVRLWRLATSVDSFTSVTIHAADGTAAYNRGVNAVAYSASARNVVSASDGRTLRVWNVDTKPVIGALDGHSANVASVIAHPTLPFIISAAEDNSVRIWDAETFGCIRVWEHSLSRVWA